MYAIRSYYGIDVILSGMTATPERAKSRAFTDSYFRTQLCLLVRADAAIEKPADGERVLILEDVTTAGTSIP